MEESQLLYGKISEAGSFLANLRIRNAREKEMLGGYVTMTDTNKKRRRKSY